MLHLLLGDVSTERVPHDGEHAEGRGEDTAGHGADALGPPAEDLLERTECPAGEVGDVDGVACGVSGRRDVQRLALVDERVGHGVALLGLDRRFDEGHGETGFQVPFNVACAYICVSG